MISERLADKLKAMLRSGQTEQILVADCLVDIAREDNEDDEFLLVVAEEIRDAAQSVVDMLAKVK